MLGGVKYLDPSKILKALTPTNEWERKKEENRRTKFSATRSGYSLKKGMAWNPLSRYPRNAPCFCGSGVKFKKCHLSRTKIAIPAEDAADIKLKMDRDPRLKEYRK